MVTEEQLKEILKQHRWTLRSDTQSGGQSVYRAQQRQGKRNVTKYLFVSSKLADMTEADVLGKLRIE
jgi:hypothetical protein